MQLKIKIIIIQNYNLTKYISRKEKFKVGGEFENI